MLGTSLQNSADRAEGEQQVNGSMEPVVYENQLEHADLSDHILFTKTKKDGFYEEFSVRTNLTIKIIRILFQKPSYFMMEN